MDSTATRLYGYTRARGEAAVLVLLNFSDEVGGFNLPADLQSKWVNVITEKEVDLTKGGAMEIDAHSVILLKSDE